MTDLTYEVVEHDGGWAYKAKGVFSETFSTHQEALNAVQRVAAEQKLSGSTEAIEFQDRKGQWHQEIADGANRPTTKVVDTA